ncbi:MAG: hypothetical protein AB7N24_18295 [Dehalococcoidia bacterium]
MGWLLFVPTLVSMFVARLALEDAGYVWWFAFAVSLSGAVLLGALARIVVERVLQRRHPL